LSNMNRPAAAASSSRERRSGRLSEFEQVSIIHQTIDERYEMNDAPLPMTPPNTMASHHDLDEFSSRDDFLNTMSLRKVLMEHDFYCKSKRSRSHKPRSDSDLDLSPPPASGSGKGKVLVGKKQRDELDNSHHDTRQRKSYASLSLPSSPGNSSSSSSSSSSSDDLDTSHHQRRPYHGPQF
jgi:hypothetical protein